MRTRKKGEIMFSEFIGSLLLLIGMICVFGCDAPAQTGLGSQQWILTEMNGKKIDGSKAFIQFNETEKRYSGNAGCNRVFGTYEITGKEIKFGAAGMTRMACIDPGVMEAEAEFAKALSEATRFKKKSKTLTIYASDRAVLKFKAAVPAGTGDTTAAGRLEDKKWMLESIGETAISKTGELPFVAFDAAKGSAGGNSGCNVFGGNYTSEGNTLKITQVISTMRACEEGDKMTVERGFLDGLQNADRYEIKGEDLFLYQGEKLLLTFTGKPK
jgi:heat shock protein HslJ